MISVSPEPLTPADRRTEWLWWGGPIFLLFALYWEGLQGWFIADDFAWLGLLRQAHGFSSVVDILFSPAAQGTIRPWSERGFFLLFEWIFGVDPLPFRIMVFATMAADLVLLQWIVRRLTHSRLAGFVAAVCWISNAALATAMSWTSAYNEVLCPLFLLGALALFFRFAETGDRRYWWWQVVVFSLGFGALEINIVYPAIALGFVLFVAPADKHRRLLLSLIPLVLISVFYFAIHKTVAPLPASGAYALQLDRRVFSTLGLYLRWAIFPRDWIGFGHSVVTERILIVTELAGLALLVAAEFRRRRYVVLFFAAWFLATLAPMLLLPNHRDDYYLTIPLISLAMLAGWGVDCGSRRLARWRGLIAVPVLVYLISGALVTHAATHWWFTKSAAVKGLVLGVEAAHEAHPGKTIVLSGITTELFENAVGQSAFFPLRLEPVYLAPGSSALIRTTADIAKESDLELDPATVQHALADEQVVLYSVAGDHLRNITEQYERSAPNRLIERLPAHADVGNPLYSWLLSKEWLPPEEGFRWMPGQAFVRLRGPERTGGKLRIEGYCPEEQLKRSSRHLVIAVNGERVGETEIGLPESSFVRLFDLPASLSGLPSVNVGIQVSPVERKSGQEYGIIFGKIAIEP